MSCCDVVSCLSVGQESTLKAQELMSGLKVAKCHVASQFELSDDITTTLQEFPPGEFKSARCNILNSLFSDLLDKLHFLGCCYCHQGSAVNTLPECLQGTHEITFCKLRDTLSCDVF